MADPETTNFSHHWYDVVSDETLRQGDIFRDIVAFWPSQDLPVMPGEPQHDQLPPFDWSRGDYILLSASCDVDQGGYPYALLSRLLPANPENLKAKGKDFLQKLEVLRQGLVPSQFLLSPFDGIDPAFPYSIVQYKTHALLPVSYLRRNCTAPRLRLRHPHRERFGNWVGSCFSRVGPENHTLIPKQSSIYPAQVLNANEE
jgi:hypothetical protein